MDDIPVVIAHRQQLGILTTLLVEVNTAVPLDVLADRVWGDHPPRRPHQALYTYLSRLRTSLAEVPGVAITRSSHGYVLRTDPDTVDLHRFRRLVREAGEADDTAARCSILTEALSLWTGPALTIVDTPWFARMRAVLEGEHLAARLDQYDARLVLGGHEELLPELSAAAHEHPLDERMAGQLLLALVRSGRQHEALHRYEVLRAALADELGVDPGHTLRELHRRILNADPGLSAPGPAIQVPRQLPAAPRFFVGRAREYAELVDAYEQAGASGLTMAISGPGGIGKTWLALQWAHAFADRFPDGQLFVDLRGFDPGGQAAPADGVLRAFLEALGVAADAVPTGLDALTARYRSVVADKRVLIVLDNARDTEQVVPLLPGAAPATVLVTSRDRLTGLVGAHGAHTVPLLALSQQAARDLLARRLGEARLTAEPGPVSELIARCAGLPVALSIVAARATMHPELPLSTWADELRDEAGRVDALDDGDPYASLAGVISWSIAALDPEQAEAFGRLGLAPGPDIDAAAAAALCGLTRSRAVAVLRVLERVSLVQQHSAGRYRMHDLLRLYASTKLAPPGPDRAAALRRLIGFYLHTGFTADRLLEPYRVPLDSAPAAPEHPYPLADNAAAMTWFGAEHECMVAVQETAVDLGWDTAVWQLAWVLNTYLSRTGRNHDVLELWRHGIAAADRLGDRATRALARRYAGAAHGAIGEHAMSMQHLTTALAMFEQAGDEAGQAVLHRDLAMTSEQMGDFPAALDYAVRTMEIVGRLDNPAWQADAHNTVGWYLARLERYSEAQAHCEIALSQCRLHEDRDGEGNTLDTLGYIAHHRGQFAEAIRCYDSSAALWRELGYTQQLAISLDECGRVHADAGDPDNARARWDEALALYQAQRRDAEAEEVRARLKTLGR
ncbi:BTAD domain-containing putative transcriptional regulator [Actinoplanes sp. NPDC051343]|uniref:AfsR/SARP family transcriptional regulator n=1 Tax=Actinoplanes sp. NPDC051343 TaxID=3363906 RepID=UPI0037B93178